MNVLLTGAYGRVGTAIIDYLSDEDDYEFLMLNRSDRDPDHPHGQFDTYIADIADYEAIRPAFDDQDAVIHLAAYPEVDGEWEAVLESNIIGMHNVLKAAREAGVERFVFGSTNHVVGMYEIDGAPGIYDPDSDLMVDHNAPHRPDSYYGASKAYGEDLGRYFVENFDYPEHFYALRICSVRHEEYDHPYGDADHGVDRGDWEVYSDDYERMVARMKAMWHSRQDLAHMVECCLHDRSVAFDVFYGVSDNDRRWFDINHAREVIGYDPQDNGEEWNESPRYGSSR